MAAAKVDKKVVIRRYHSGGTIFGALAELQNDLLRGVIQEVWIDHIYAQNTNYDGWSIGLVYRDTGAQNESV